MEYKNIYRKHGTFYKILDVTPYRITYYDFKSGCEFNVISVLSDKELVFNDIFPKDSIVSEDVCNWLKLLGQIP